MATALLGHRSVLASPLSLVHDRRYRVPIQEIFVQLVEVGRATSRTQANIVTIKSTSHRQRYRARIFKKLSPVDQL